MKRAGLFSLTAKACRYRLGSVSFTHTLACNVGSTTDFFNALQSIHSTPNEGDRITSDFTMNQQILAIIKNTNNSLIVEGNNRTTDGNSLFRPFFVGGGISTIRDLGAWVPLTSKIYIDRGLQLQLVDCDDAHSGSGGLSIQW